MNYDKPRSLVASFPSYPLPNKDKDTLSVHWSKPTTLLNLILYNFIRHTHWVCAARALAFAQQSFNKRLSLSHSFFQIVCHAPF